MSPDPHQLLDPQVIQDPYPFYAAVRTAGPVWQAGDSGIYLVAGFDALADAARRTGDFSSVLTHLVYRQDGGMPAAAPMDVGPPTLAISDPPEHTLHKRLVFPKFVSRRMSLIEEDLVRFTKARLDAIEEMDRFDLMDEVGGAVPVHAIARLIGLQSADERALLQLAYDTSAMTGGTMTLAGLAALHQQSNEIRDWLESQLNAVDGSGEDVLNALRRAIDDDALSLGQALITLVTLFSAGAESTAALLGSAAAMLARDPDLRERLRGDPALVAAFIEEAGRLESPFRHHLRSVPRDTELGGTPIPAGSSVMLMWGAVNRDPAKFPDPDVLRLDRKAQHVVFGRGIHLCVGAALARMEARIVLSAMLERGRFPALDPNDPPVWEYNAMVRRYDRLPMRWGGVDA